MEYRSFHTDELTPALLKGFVRRQVVTQCVRRVEGAWRVVDAPFVDDWDEKDRARVLSAIRAVLETGGLALGAFENGALMGFALVCAQPIGSRNQYMDLDSFHVSAPARRRGIGRALFERACAFAREKGAQSLYISAHSSAESQAFYIAMGCTDAAEINQAHTLDEPCDRQMERVLQ